jgi:hypothetical protein
MKRLCETQYIYTPWSARCQWFMLIIPATWEVEIRRIVVPDQPREKSFRDPRSMEKRWA